MTGLLHTAGAFQHESAGLFRLKDRNRSNYIMKKLERVTFRTSRQMDFSSKKELSAQTGHAPDDWPLVVLKELIDNALDACEDADIAPVIDVHVDQHGISVRDNGPGIPEKTIAGVLDFSVRVSSREAYVSPTRGAQGNALKTLLAMPLALDGQQGFLEIASHGTRRKLTATLDRIRQVPKLEQQSEPDPTTRAGTKILVSWPNSASSILTQARERFLQIAVDYTFLNPHLSLKVDWFGDVTRIEATKTTWSKWQPSHPTSPHWYTLEQFERLIGAYIAHDADHDKIRTVREFVSDFSGLSASAKQKQILDATGMTRMGLADLAAGTDLNHDLVAKLLTSMKMHSKPISPSGLGFIGREHLARRFGELGCEMESFKYSKVVDNDGGIPYVSETAFAWCEDLKARRLVTGVNWSPGILSPFRDLGKTGESLDAILEQQRTGKNEPVVFFLHMACPRVTYTDRGKSALVIAGSEPGELAS